MTGARFTANALMDQLVALGYSPVVVDFTFNDSSMTPLGKADRLSMSLGSVLEMGGDGGVYALSVANGLHSMMVTYDKGNFTLLDQGTKWNIVTGSPAKFDAQMVNITKQLVRFGKPSYSSVLKVSRVFR
ncbi:MAG: hypothetical protein EOP84_04650 [Verrucomicrobiaceae bacterium]|nr:MAG: hypothetical protein EOP84_04650 [Verrucomicrobiaceae bacterium]